MHILPELKELERRYPDDLVVIGVHSAKFDDEGKPENIRQAILRYEIEHPVCVDSDLRVWRSYGVRSWPTLVLVDPTGAIVEVHAGEITAATAGPAIARVIDGARAAGTLRPGRMTWSLERDRQPTTVLSHPGKVLADAAGGRLFIADSTHHRIVVCGLDGTVQQTIGGGVPGFVDGSFAQARFRQPQGMALVGDLLYVADTENHSLRAADLKAGTVTTVVGTGHKPDRYNLAGRGRQVALHSPWDVLAHGDRLYVANAGSHQIWVVDPRTADARPYAGTGREDLLDAAAGKAALAQPSALCLLGDRLVFADSETSAIRSVGLAGQPRVATFIGQGLFEFGDIEGDRRTARLQHPLGVTALDGVLYVADTYNNRVKRLDPATGRLTRFAGTGAEGTTDGPLDQAAFNEPGGICAGGGRLYVADTNNNTIRVIDPKAGTVSTVMLGEPDRAAPPMPEVVYAAAPAVRLKAGTATIELTVRPQAGWHRTVGAPVTVVVGGKTQRITEAGDVLRAPVEIAADTTSLDVQAQAYLCTEAAGGACVVVQGAWRVPVTVAAEGGQRVALTLAQP